MKNPYKRTYIRRGIWHLGGRKKQKRGFLSILGSLDKPLVVSAAGAVSGEILKRIEKNFGRRKRRLK